jgi:hypothetical protein
MPEGHINKVTDLQETKFLCVFSLTCALVVFICPNVTACISV